MKITWNADDAGSGIVLGNAGMRATFAEAGARSIRANYGRKTGKFYKEFTTPNASAGALYVGLATKDSPLDTAIGANAQSWSMQNNSNTTVRHAAAATDVMIPLTAGSVLGLAVDMTGKTIKYYQNGTLLHTQDLTEALVEAGTGYYPAASGLGGTILDARFRRDSFTQAIPTGYSAWEEEPGFLLSLYDGITQALRGDKNGSIPVYDGFKFKMSESGAPGAYLTVGDDGDVTWKPVQGATNSEAGVVSLATGDEAKLGASSEKAVTPAALKTKLDATVSAIATENIAAGDVVNIYTTTNGLRVRRAVASDPQRFANGHVRSAVISGDSVDVRLQDVLESSGLTPGLPYYLSATAGKITRTLPTVSGTIVQKVGRAISATELRFEPDEAMRII